MEVTQRNCPRCGSAQDHEADNTLLFCWNCGLPQVVLSEELRDQAAEGERAAADSAEASKTPSPEAVVWRGAIMAALLAGGVAAGLTLISLAVPAVVLFTWLWAVGAPVVALGIYSSRFRSTRISPGFGARLGLLCGLAIALANATINTIGLLISRYVLHRAAEFDGQLAAFYAQVSASTVARSGKDAAEPFVKLLTIPEFRAGILLSSIGVFIGGYLLFSAAGGAFAGMLRARSQPKQSPPLL
jgi:hypothetical protein